MKKVAALVALALLAVACGDDDDDAGGATTTEAEAEAVTLELMTHDSFAVSDDVLAAFTEETGIEVEIVASGDAGAALNLAILNKDDPLGDVFFGVDNTFLTRALDEDIFIPYESPALDTVDARFVLDEEHRVTPIDHGDVCVNFDKEAYPADAPATFEDLADREQKGKLVVENPATSSPGLAFLLATIAEFGEDGWQGYWEQLEANDVQVAAGWEEAYNQSFSGGAATGDRPLVVSYATSPPAEVIFADPRPATAPTGVMDATCFGQIETAGILRGTEHVFAAVAQVAGVAAPFEELIQQLREGHAVPELAKALQQQEEAAERLAGSSSEWDARRGLEATVQAEAGREAECFVGADAE
jgi:thiamine transport system substrate-binding protein